MLKYAKHIEIVGVPILTQPVLAYKGSKQRRPTDANGANLSAADKQPICRYEMYVSIYGINSICHVSKII